jgi:hypothetical protein
VFISAAECFDRPALRGLRSFVVSCKAAALYAKAPGFPVIEAFAKYGDVGSTVLRKRTERFIPDDKRRSRRCEAKKYSRKNH